MRTGCNHQSPLYSLFRCPGEDPGQQRRSFCQASTLRGRILRYYSHLTVDRRMLAEETKIFGLPIGRVVFSRTEHVPQRSEPHLFPVQRKEVPKALARLFEQLGLPVPTENRENLLGWCPNWKSTYSVTTCEIDDDSLLYDILEGGSPPDTKVMEYLHWFKYYLYNMVMQKTKKSPPGVSPMVEVAPSPCQPSTEDLHQIDPGLYCLLQKKQAFNERVQQVIKQHLL
ncbi:hypothetical protein QOT17_011412 [Balamuthia mandrillaris]